MTGPCDNSPSVAFIDNDFRLNLVTSSLRTWLVLGRVSNLPTVWSNCLAAWLLGGTWVMDWPRFVLVCFGATLLYVSGMYLNDAFDERFDRQHRRERPIPSGAVAVAGVWRAGIVLMAAGMLVFVPFGWLAALNALILACCILIYNAVHKLVTFSPLLMAFCRFFLYLTAVSAATGGLTGAAVWGAVAMALYITGLSYVARKEASGVVVHAWPTVLLLAPVGLALTMNDGVHRQPTLLVSLIVGLWLFRSLRWAFVHPRNIGRAVSGMLAGIVLVDLLAVANHPPQTAAIFIGFFLLALVFQRFVPAT